MKTTEFKTWKTIKLGTGLKTIEDFQRAFEEAGIYFDNMAPFLRHPSFRVSDELIEVDLVKVSNEDLGHDHNTHVIHGLELRAEIIRLALAQGLVVCPAEVGPQLRLQYRGNDYVLIGTEPLPYIFDGREGLAGMGIAGSDEGKLYTHCFTADWFIMNKVFVKPRK
ncbi:MAG: hypothetical protein Q8Q49_00390 [bacterium]|nr:hypothetical protein [bacterium]